MEKAKRKKLGSRILSFVLTATLVVGLVPGNVLTASAEESSATAPSVTAFATPEQLMSSDNFALHTDYTGGTQKVYFGTNRSNKQTWYIAGGEDHDGDGIKDSIVLLCDPLLPMATGTEFEDDYSTNKTYDNSWNCTYGTPPSEVYPNHYGASDLRGVLQGYTSNDNTEKFSAAEKELMQSTKVYTDDDKRKDEGETNYTYYTEDVLYPAYGDYGDDQYITVGANSAESLNGGLKVSLTSAPYNGGDIFWLRAPHCDASAYALVADPGHFVYFEYVNPIHTVVPAFRLNLSSVLFASAATAATSDASLTDTMTFRVDGDDKITSQASYSTDNVIVDAAEEETVYLYVQGKNGTIDWVYSQEVSADTTIATGTIKSGAKDSNGSAVSLTSVDLSQCEIWLEKKVAEDNLVYAVMAKEIETIATVAVTDITAPVAGAELDVAATCNTTGVSTTTPTVSYTKNGESVSGNANYLADYTAVVELEAEDGYTFTDETTATVNGNEASVSYDADTGKLTVSYTFDKTAKLPLGNAYYVTKDELMSSFDLDGSEDAVGKVYFGTNGTGDGAVSQSWYIAGSDADNSIVLLCDPMLPLATGKVFEDSTANKTYDDNWGCTYDSAPSEVYSNHYGASDFRLTTLKGLETGAFTESEQSMMLETTVYTNDRIDSNYSTTDTLYAAYGEYNGRYITVGANSAENLNGGLKVSLSSLPYNTHNLPFWLRTRHYNHSGYAQVVPSSSLSTDARPVNETSAVVPAFRLNLSSVLFASAATAATSGASIETGAYGFYVFSFRMDGTEKLVSEAVYTEDGVMVNYDAADRTDGGPVYLYVQDADSVYSVAITEDTTVALASMTGIDSDSLTDESIKIWLEKSEDNLTYAVMAEYHENQVDAGSDGYCDVCGTKKDGISATLAGHSVSLGGQIGMNFYMDLADSVLADGEAYMLFTLPGGSTQSVAVNGGETENIGGKTYYVFTCNVAAKDMAGTITAKIVCGDGSEGTEYTYSVKDYAEDVMDKYEESSNEYKLAKAMLNYGAYAQKYFDPNVAPEKLANEGCAYEAEEFKVTTSVLNAYVPTVTDNSATLNYAGSTLILEADINVRHYFKLAGESYSGTLTQYTAPDGETVEGTYYFFDKTFVAAKLGDMTSYTVEGIDFKYCPLSYVTTVLAKKNAELVNEFSDLEKDTALQNLMKALYLYYKATVAPNNQS